MNHNIPMQGIKDRTGTGGQHEQDILCTNLPIVYYRRTSGCKCGMNCP